MSKAKIAKKPRKQAKKRVLKNVAEHALLAGLLREIREVSGLSQQKLATELGHAQTWVHFREAGDYRISAVDFVLWCQACGASPAKEIERLKQSLA